MSASSCLSRSFTLLLVVSGCVTELTGTGEGILNPSRRDAGAPDAGADAAIIRTDGGQGDAFVQPEQDAQADGDVPLDAASIGDAGADAKTDVPDAQVSDASPLDDGSTFADGSQADAGARGSGPGDWSAGDYPPEADSYLSIPVPPFSDRQFRVHVPPGYDESTPMPMVFAFHPADRDAIAFSVDDANLPAKADESGFILVMPNASFGQTFNGGTCCGLAALIDSQDVIGVRTIFEEVKGHLNVDLDRVFATGFSGGAYMAYRLACEASDIFAAVAPVSGALGLEAISPSDGGIPSDLISCQPEYPVSVFAAHGTNDTKVAYDYFSPSLGHLAGASGCESTPAAGPVTGGGDTSCVTYQGCQAVVEITGCTVQDGGRCWFGSDSCTGGGPSKGSDWLDANDVIWSFFERNPRGTAGP